jgi:hypothetical protein
MWWGSASLETWAFDHRTEQFTAAGAKPEQSLSVEAHPASPTFSPLPEPERHCGTLRRHTYDITVRRSFTSRYLRESPGFLTDA